jgi:hypothetical protein
VVSLLAVLLALLRQRKEGLALRDSVFLSTAPLLDRRLEFSIRTVLARRWLERAPQKIAIGGHHSSKIPSVLSFSRAITSIYGSTSSAP